MSTSDPLAVSSPTAAAAGSDRRATKRFSAAEVPWIHAIKAHPNEPARLLDVSQTGMLIETQGPLQPGRKRAMYVDMAHEHIRTEVLVLRTQLVCLDAKGRPTYRSALFFTESIDLRLPETPRTAMATTDPIMTGLEDFAPALTGPQIDGALESLWATETGSEVASASRITESGCIVETCVPPAADQIASLNIFFSPTRHLVLTGRVVHVLPNGACAFRFSDLAPEVQRALRVEIRCGTKAHRSTSLALSRATAVDVPFEPLMDIALGDAVLHANHW